MLAKQENVSLKWNMENPKNSWRVETDDVGA